MTRRGVFPGSFNPLTVGHLAIAEAAVEQCDLELLDLAVSKVALAKEADIVPRVEDRIGVLEHCAASRPWLGVVLTERQLLVDIAFGYDVLVVGADKWEQLHDVRFYASAADRDDAIARLPPVVVVPRLPRPTPPGVATLVVPDHVGPVSSTRARAGEADLMVPEARQFDDETGAWSDPDRYARWLAGHRP